MRTIKKPEPLSKRKTETARSSWSQSSWLVYCGNTTARTHCTKQMTTFNSKATC